MVNYAAQVLVFIAIFNILALSLNLVLGWAGIFSAMHAVFFGIGAYLTAFLVIQGGVPFPLDLVASVVITAMIGGFTAGPLMRLTQDYVLVGTLALQLVFSAVFLNWTGGTGGSYGVYGIPRPSLGGVSVVTPSHYALLAMVVVALCFLFVRQVAHSPLGLALKGLRQDPVLAESLGKDVSRQRVVAFALGGGVAAVAGGLYARYVGYINPQSFDVLQSLNILIYVVVGGLGNLWGTVVATSVLVMVPQVLRFIPATSTAVPHIQLTLLGALLLLLVRLRPQGLIREQPLARGRALPAPSGAAEPERSIAGILGTAPALTDGGALLQFQEVSKSFGGIAAVRQVSFDIAAQRVTASIGPNGAGKTTLFNLATGHLRAISKGSSPVKGRPR